MIRMVSGPTLTKILPDSTYEFHEESVLLVSEKNTCHGTQLDEFLDDILTGCSGYKSHFDYSPHPNGFDLLKDATKSDHILSLENSIWLVEANCFHEKGMDLRSIVQLLLPTQAELVLWDSPQTSKLSEGELEEIDKLSHKILRVKSKQSLQTAVKTYFTRNCHVKRSNHCIEWNNKALEKQESII